MLKTKTKPLLTSLNLRRSVQKLYNAILTAKLPPTLIFLTLIEAVDSYIKTSGSTRKKKTELLKMSQKILSQIDRIR